MTTLFDLSQFTLTKELSDTLSQTCNSGVIAEIAFCLEATKLGYEVFTPLSHSTKTDIVIMKPSSRTWRVQIKKATYQTGDSWKFMIGSGKPSCANNPKEYGSRYTKYQENDFDVIAAYIQEKELFAFYFLTECLPRSSVNWNAFKSRSNNWEIFETK